MSVEIRPLREQEWAPAMRLTARAFLHEPFIIGLFGPDPVARYPHVLAAYGARAWDADGDDLGAFSDGALIGAIGLDRIGRCHQCRAAELPDDITGEPSMYARNVAAAHAAQDPAHGWLGRVAVEPALHGNGIGRALVDAALRHAAERATPAVLLDAEVHRVSYYEPHGFSEVDRFDGSVGNTLVLMRAGTGA